MAAANSNPSKFSDNDTTQILYWPRFCADIDSLMNQILYPDYLLTKFLYWPRFSTDQDSPLTQILYWLRFSTDPDSVLTQILNWLRLSTDPDSEVALILNWLRFSTARLYWPIFSTDPDSLLPDSTDPHSLLTSLQTVNWVKQPPGRNWVKHLDVIASLGQTILGQSASPDKTRSNCLSG